ncbi:MAG: heat-inducible transcription repressor HrcA [Magnetococcales bacterium]|nr:heat-inducible transcription repressor HrcA [Magnetococcales bacterium]
MLSKRQSQVLKGVVDTYIQVGEPVGSATVCRSSDLSISSATVRQVMVELDQLGYLYQPHTSAGRIPTDRGFRAFVDSLDVIPLSDDERALIIKTLNTGDGDVDLTLKEMSRILALISQQACLVLTPGLENAVIRKVQLVGLGSGKCSRILMLLVSDSGQLLNRIFSTNNKYIQKDLDRFGGELSTRLAGLTLRQARKKLVTELADGVEAYHIVCKWMLDLVFQVSMTNDQLIINGRSNLIGGSGFNQARLSEILEALEEKRHLADLLENCLQVDGVQLFIGTESQVCPMDECSVVAAKFAGPEDQRFGTMGVLGPMRLNYARIIPLVDYAAKALGERFSQDLVFSRV